MKSTITIAVSSVCKHQICQITDRLKIQLRTVGCSIFYFCSKQTMNVFFHCTFTRICVDFSCKTAFISYRVMSAKTRVLKCCCLLLPELSFEKVWGQVVQMVKCRFATLREATPSPGQRRVRLHICYRFANRHQIHRHQIAGSEINFLIRATTGDQSSINFREQLQNTLPLGLRY